MGFGFRVSGFGDHLGREVCVLARRVVRQCPFRCGVSEREFFIDNLLVRIHYIIVMIKWTGLALRSFTQVTVSHFPCRFLQKSLWLVPGEGCSKVNFSLLRASYEPPSRWVGCLRRALPQVFPFSGFKAENPKAFSAHFGPQVCYLILRNPRMSLRHFL